MPAKPSNFLYKLVENAIENLQVFYKISGSIDHNGEKGGFREFFISQLLRPLLPMQYGISSGIITDYSGKQSAQTDIIIYDKRLMTPIWQSEGSGIFPIDSVLAAIEIKSKLSSNHHEQL